MTFWIISAFFTAIATAISVLPIWRARNTSVDATDYDREIYSARIEEIDQDFKIGRLSQQEQSAAKIEEGRRLLQAAKSASGSTQATGDGRRGVWALGVIVAVPLITLGLYLQNGSPGLDDMPLASRQTENRQFAALESLLARAEAQLRNNPEDGRGWRVVAPVYMRMGRTEDAITAYRNSIRLNDYNQEEITSLGEAIVIRDRGIVNSDAQELFQRAVENNSQDPKARFFLAIALSQEGKSAESAQAWRALLKDAPSDANWKPVAVAQLNEQLAKLGKPAEVVETSPSLRGPSQEDVENAGQMSAEDRQSMIEGMVASLSEKLKDEPDNEAGWRRLVRSYMVLKRPEDAATAIQSARAAITNNDAFTKFLDEAETALANTKTQEN